MYDTLLELCKEKKMSFFKPARYVDFIPAKLSEGKVWYVYFYVRNPDTGKFKRFRTKLERFRTKKEKREAARSIIAHIDEKLALGWNPIYEDTAPNSSCLMSDALDAFLKIKGREMEENSMRSYRSYVKILSGWLQKKGAADKMVVSSFSKALAIEFLDDVEREGKVSFRTFNNYILFYRTLFNWMQEKGYISANPFSDMKKKPKRLTHKIRRILTDSELSSLFRYLHDKNRIYLVICLLCYCCLMRPKEIALLKCSDIDVDRQLVHIRSEIAKNDNESYRTIPDSMMPYIRELDLSNPEYFLFAAHKDYDFSPGTRQVCSRKIAKYWSDHIRPSLGFDKELQFYSLKDTGVTNMVGSGVPISFVQQQADHSSISMTAIYLGKQQAKANEALKEVDIIK